MSTALDIGFDLTTGCQKGLATMNPPWLECHGRLNPSPKQSVTVLLQNGPWFKQNLFTPHPQTKYFNRQTRLYF